jgi:hypothetical protein
MLFKSLGSLLCVQERVGDQWKARFAADAALAPYRDTHRILAMAAPGPQQARRRPRV